MPDACYYCYLDTKSTMIITIFIFYPVTQKYKRENVNVSVTKYLLLLDCEIDWCLDYSKLWLFYVNRNVMILPRLKYFESPAAATIQASVCLSAELFVFQNLRLNKWKYFCNLDLILHSPQNTQIIHFKVSTAQAV